MKFYFSQENNRGRKIKQLSILFYRILLAQFSNAIVYECYFMTFLVRSEVSLLTRLLLHLLEVGPGSSTILVTLGPFLVLHLNKDLTSLDTHVNRSSH